MVRKTEERNIQKRVGLFGDNLYTESVVAFT